MKIKGAIKPDYVKCLAKYPGLDRNMIRVATDHLMDEYVGDSFILSVHKEAEREYNGNII